MTTTFSIAFNYLWTHAWDEDRVRLYNSFASSNEKSLVRENTRENINHVFNSAYDMASAIDDGHYKLNDAYFIVSEDFQLISGDKADTLISRLLTDDEFEDFGNYLEDCLGWTEDDLHSFLS